MIDFKQEARALVNKFYNTNSHSNSVEVRMSIAKQFALVCVDEIIKANPTASQYIDGDFGEGSTEHRFDNSAYYEQLKQAINEL